MGRLECSYTILIGSTTTPSNFQRERGMWLVNILSENITATGREIVHLFILIQSSQGTNQPVRPRSALWLNKNTMK